MKELEMVKGSKGDWYTIGAEPDRLVCDCPNWKFTQRAENHDCKHIKKFKTENPDWKEKLPKSLDEQIQDVIGGKN